MTNFLTSAHCPRRTVFLSFVPDEEIGGGDGMCEFCTSTEFQALNVGVALDEGLAREDSDMTIFYGERHVMWTRVRNICCRVSGCMQHGIVGVMRDFCVGANDWNTVLPLGHIR